MTTKAKQAERDEARANLRKLLKPGQTVYTILRHCSSSGMSRVIDLCIIDTRVDHEYPVKANPDYPGQRDYDAKPIKTKRTPYIRSIGWTAAKAMNDRYDDKNSGIRIGGCGMDMGFALVYNLGRTLWPNGTPKPHGTRNGEPDRDGGYALKQSWL